MVRFSLIFKGLLPSKPQNGKGSYWWSIGRLAREKWLLEGITNGQPVEFEYLEIGILAGLD
jgi:hypothetical protein